MNTRPLAKLATVIAYELTAVYELIGCGFEFRCCHLIFRYHFCFGQKVLDIQVIIKCTLEYRIIEGFGIIGEGGGGGLKVLEKLIVGGEGGRGSWNNWEGGDKK